MSTSKPAPIYSWNPPSNEQSDGSMERKSRKWVLKCSYQQREQGDKWKQGKQMVLKIEGKIAALLGSVSNDLKAKKMKNGFTGDVRCVKIDHMYHVESWDNLA